MIKYIFAKCVLAQNIKVAVEAQTTEISMLSKEDNDNNERKKIKLVQLIASNDAVLIVGAGSSYGLYPLWSELLEQLEEIAIELNPEFSKRLESESNLKYANRLKESLGSEAYINTMESIFSYNVEKPPCYEYHKNLCRMPFKGIVTTNYDSVLEHAMAEVYGMPDVSVTIDGGQPRSKVYGFLQSLNYSDTKKQKFILHLHGKVDREATVILSEDDYEEKYGFTLNNQKDLIKQMNSGEINEETFNNYLVKSGNKWTLHRKVLWSLLATRRVVFVGFSMTDEYFNKMLDTVKSDFRIFNYDTHYLVLRVETQEEIETKKALIRNLKLNYGIETVLYIDQGKGFENFIKEIYELVNLETNKFISNKQIDEIKLDEDNNETNELLFNISKNQNAIN